MRWAFGVVAIALAVGYPFAIWLGLMHFSVRAVSLGALAVAVVLAAIRYRRAEREHVVAVLRIPLSVVAVVALGAILDDPRFMLGIPVLINGVLFLTFAASLRGMPVVERFARMQLSVRGAHDLAPRQIAHCRQATMAWSAFFLLNGAVALALSASAPMSWWAAYNSGIAYGLVALMFVGEYVLRQYRFREYGGGLHDRLLSRIFPADRTPAAGETDR